MKHTLQRLMLQDYFVSHFNAFSVDVHLFSLVITVVLATFQITAF